jgi:hypothetical protein
MLVASATTYNNSVDFNQLADIPEKRRAQQCRWRYVTIEPGPHPLPCHGETLLIPDDVNGEVTNIALVEAVGVEHPTQVLKASSCLSANIVRSDQGARLIERDLSSKEQLIADDVGIPVPGCGGETYGVLDLIHDVGAFSISFRCR